MQAAALLFNGHSHLDCNSSLFSNLLYYLPHDYQLSFDLVPIRSYHAYQKFINRGRYQYFRCYNPDMFWVTFFISGLIVASIPWVASHFSNRIAGYLVLVPVMMTLSFLIQYLAHGQKATIQMIEATLWGLPTLLIFGLSLIVALKNSTGIYLGLLISLPIWLLSVYVVNLLANR